MFLKKLPAEGHKDIFLLLSRDALDLLELCNSELHQFIRNNLTNNSVCIRQIDIYLEEEREVEPRYNAHISYCDADFDESRRLSVVQATMQHAVLFVSNAARNGFVNDFELKDISSSSIAEPMAEVLRNLCVKFFCIKSSLTVMPMLPAPSFQCLLLASPNVEQLSITRVYLTKDHITGDFIRRSAAIGISELYVSSVVVGGGSPEDFFESISEHDVVSFCATGNSSTGKKVLNLTNVVVTNLFVQNLIEAYQSMDGIYSVEVQLMGVIPTQDIGRYEEGAEITENGETIDFKVLKTAARGSSAIDEHVADTDAYATEFRVVLRQDSQHYLSVEITAQRDRHNSSSEQRSPSPLQKRMRVGSFAR